MNGATYSGTYDESFEFPLLPIDIIFDNTTILPLEILTNPHECNLTWAGGYFFGISPLWMETNKSTSNFIGRILLDEQYVGGQVRSDFWNEWTIYVGTLNEAGNGTEVQSFDSGFQILCGYSDGMELHLIQIEFDDDPFGGHADFVGIDEIHNFANTLVRQKVTHRKSIRQETTITITETWITTTTKTVTVNLLFYKKKKTETHTTRHSISNSYTTVEETDIEVSREIIVAPKTRVQACSTVTIKQGSEVQYTALAMYKARGLETDELFSIVQNELKDVKPWVEGGQVYFEMQDKMTYSLAMATNFVIVPFEAINGCSALQNITAAQARQRRARHVDPDHTSFKTEL